MNSKVRFKDISTDKEIIYTLVFPEDAEINRNKISILAPIGSALIGHSVGNIVFWQVPAGVTKIRIEEILYQPESAGNFSL